VEARVGGRSRAQASGLCGGAVDVDERLSRRAAPARAGAVGEQRVQEEALAVGDAAVGGGDPVQWPAQFPAVAGVLDEGERDFVHGQRMSGTVPGRAAVPDPP
jgi:hypothetical protein